MCDLHQPGKQTHSLKLRFAGTPQVHCASSWVDHCATKQTYEHRTHKGLPTTSHPILFVEVRCKCIFFFFFFFAGLTSDSGHRNSMEGGESFFFFSENITVSIFLSHSTFLLLFIFHECRLGRVNKPSR